jgi:rhodanese-related sulfurtransferase
MTIQTKVRPSDAFSQQASHLFLDVRTPAEYEEVHIDGAVLHPLSDLNSEHVKSLISGKAGCIVVCGSGGRAGRACEQLLSSGLSAISVLEGGVKGWIAAGLPVVRGKKTISLERQVRIAAGALVFTGSVLGYFVNPSFIALSAFVGAGLVFAGVTDTCGMAMVLAKMPWNTRGAKSCCAMPSAGPSQAPSQKTSCSL